MWMVEASAAGCPCGSNNTVVLACRGDQSILECHECCLMRAIQRPLQRPAGAPSVAASWPASSAATLLILVLLPAVARGQEASHSETRLFRPDGYTRVLARSSSGPAETAIVVSGREMVARSGAGTASGASAELLFDEVYVVWDAQGRYRAYLVRNVFRNDHGEARLASQTTRLMFRPRPYTVVENPRPHPSPD